MKLKQARTPKFSTRAYTRCRLCGRPHSVLRKYGVCRICFRELAYKGQIPGVRKDADRKKSFRDAKLTFTEEQVKAETARCLGCGASVVDPNKCIGCGVCTTKCEFDAIKLHRERPECSKMIPSEKKLPYVLGNGAKQDIKIKFSKKKES